jgi:hypothetical protein
MDDLAIMTNLLNCELVLPCPSAIFNGIEVAALRNCELRL